jgi:hypothetical protein
VSHLRQRTTFPDISPHRQRRRTRALRRLGADRRTVTASHRRASGVGTRYRHRHAARLSRWAQNHPVAESCRAECVGAASSTVPCCAGALLILGVTEAVCGLATFVAVLYSRGWTWAAAPSPSTLAIASGSAFAAIALGQMANAFACRSETLPVWGQKLLSNRLLIGAVAAELVLLGVFLGFPPLARLLGGSWPTPPGWGLALRAVPMIIAVDAAYKALLTRRLLASG